METRTCLGCSGEFKVLRYRPKKFCTHDCYARHRKGKSGPGQFRAGVVPPNKVPVGTVKIRTRHGRGGVRRAWVKVAEPNVWVLRARAVWERANGAIPRGMHIHHKNHNKLDDELENLELMTNAEHLAEHRPHHKSAGPAIREAWKRRQTPGVCDCGDAFTFDSVRPMTKCRPCRQKVYRARSNARRRERRRQNK